MRPSHLLSPCVSISIFAPCCIPLRGPTISKTRSFQAAQETLVLQVVLLNSKDSWVDWDYVAGSTRPSIPTGFALVEEVAQLVVDSVFNPDIFMGGEGVGVMPAVRVLIIIIRSLCFSML